MKIIATLLATLLSFGALANELPRNESSETAQLYIISPQDGDVIKGKVTVIFGLKGMGVAPAGTDKKHTGHHHLLIDHKELPAFDRPMGADVMHFGGGQTETTLELSPGEHTLQLILGDMYHIPHKPAVYSKKITITVAE